MDFATEAAFLVGQTMFVVVYCNCYCFLDVFPLIKLIVVEKQVLLFLLKKKKQTKQDFGIQTNSGYSIENS